MMNLHFSWASSWMFAKKTGAGRLRIWYIGPLRIMHCPGEREATRCGAVFPMPPHTGAWDTRYDCTLPAGHAGEHGV